jgi:phosphopentomutase
MNINRVILIVLDSLGIGELPDAHKYGDEGSNTVGNIVKARGEIKIPNMCSLGFANIDGVDYIDYNGNIRGSYGRMAEKSVGKDTTTGHWEIAGLITEKEFPLYPNGFPDEVISEFKLRTGLGVLGNYPESGTEIIKNLGEEHLKTGYPIVYTSADSVFQIAAHEEVIRIEKLYEICKVAREILRGPHAVARVIARPFTGKPGNFKRTERRKDFSLEPTGTTVLDKLKKHGYDVIGIGKIEDIFAGHGITQAIHTFLNNEGVKQIIHCMKDDTKGLIFANLVDFDMLYGHRNDIEGYAKSLEEFDVNLPEIMLSMKDEDLLIITADHGCDPTRSGTDHSREYVPLLLYGKNIKSGINLGTRETFSDIAATVSQIFGLGFNTKGTKPFLERTK